ncbi:MAG: type II secretion system protein [Candidatus Omnitrophica bacterium]|nr:type II secretion system protein [Candidatus Omnitrophota bacterium]
MNMNNERGVILITTLLFVAIIAILAACLFAQSIYERRQIEMQTNRIIAFQMAEAAIDDAITNLAGDSNFSGTGTTTVTLGDGVYSSIVTQPDPANNPNVRRIAATGAAPGNDNTQYAYQARAVTTYVQLSPQSLFNHAVFTEDKIKMSGNATTDSYNSGLGAYGGTNIGANGDIGSNTTTASNISLNGNVRINGNAEVGPGGNPNQVIELTGAAAISGSKTSESTKVALPPVVVPDGLSNSGTINIGDNTVKTLPGGTYWFDKVKISGTAKLILQGAVTFYVTGEVEIEGNGVATSGNNPSNFVVNVAGRQEVELGGNVNFYGVIYAPEAGKNGDPAKVRDNAQLYGAIIAYKFEGEGNSKIHYDEALASSGGGSQNTVSVISWQES